MSVHVSSWAWRLDVGDPETKLVLLKLADHADDRGYCFPSIELITRDTCLSRSTVIRRLKRLEELGFLRRERQREGSRNLPNRYQLTRPADSVPETLSPVTSEFPPASGDSVPGTPEPSKGNRHARSNDRARAVWNPIYDALVAACFPAGATITRREQQQVVTAAKNIASGNGTAELVPRVVRAYQSDTSLSKCALTPMALSNNWSKLAPVASIVACESCGISGGRHAADCERIAA